MGVFDEREIKQADNFVLMLNDGLLNSRFLVLVLSPKATLSQWVEQEWTSFMAKHGPIGRVITVMLEPVELPPLLSTIQTIDATHLDVVRVTEALIAAIGRKGEMKVDDTRALYIGQELTFVIAQTEQLLRVTDPFGKTRQVAKPWLKSNQFRIAYLGFNQLTKISVESDDQRAELHDHARTLGKLLFEVLFSSNDILQLLQQACIPGRPRPLIMIRSDDDVLLSLPWELIYHDDAFLVRDVRVDMVRSTVGEVDLGTLLREPDSYFRLNETKKVLWF
jgi:hypothetical protein